ncbi:MAG TPA: indolepyruvate oxidoreductase subunit beta [Bacteroidaceae bacterium]|nr:indolepyruvate oxidoreductase subunit beta [Bacteroidaceae bacterium]
MKTDIILAGVGGQGILSIAAVIGTAAVESGLYLKQSEVHGMSQRGGAVQSHLRISDRPIYSDLIPEGSCDIILAVEPMEALRYLPYLDDEGWLITNSDTVKNIPDYPDEDQVFKEIKLVKNHRIVNATDIARKLGIVKASNIVMLGAASDQLGFPPGSLEKALNIVFGRKGEDIVKMNISAFESGRDNGKFTETNEFSNG